MDYPSRGGGGVARLVNGKTIRSTHDPVWKSFAVDKRTIVCVIWKPFESNPVKLENVFARIILYGDNVVYYTYIPTVLFRTELCVGSINAFIRFCYNTKIKKRNFDFHFGQNYIFYYTTPRLEQLWCNQLHILLHTTLQYTDTIELLKYYYYSTEYDTVIFKYIIIIIFYYCYHYAQQYSTR